MVCLYGISPNASDGLQMCFGGMWRGCSAAAARALYPRRDRLSPDQQIKLSVGGSVFLVYEKEMLAAGSPLLTEAIQAGPCDDGEYFLDRDGTYFHFTLEYIRHGASAFTCQTSSGEPRLNVSHNVRRHLLLEASVLGLSDMRKTLEELNIATPLTSSSGRQAREAIQNGYYQAAVTRSENDLPILACLSSEGASLHGFEKCLACCNPIAWTVIPPEE
eukprot:TRINITY_DN102737_c0_g1_i1.p1 TRINITY_DN102737_c0_g1~~TRINITY_DN102737_c0_g1_i1.p1  ORF type:complete len:218 (+),score=26.54 TRINITY_DN102737_c0_g1_i1:72-725(+)